MDLGIRGKHALVCGAACAFLGSIHSRFMTGQNILLDGGAYPNAF